MRFRALVPTLSRPGPRGDGLRSAPRASTGRADRRGPPRRGTSSPPAASTSADRPRARPVHPGSRPGPSSASGSPSCSTTQHPVEHQEQLVAGSPWRTSSAPSLTARIVGLRPTAHDVGGQSAFECGLHRGDQRGRVLVAPRGLLAERRAVPALEVGEPDLLGQDEIVVVDPMPWELARTDDLALGWCRLRATSPRRSSRPSAHGTARTVGGSPAGVPGGRSDRPWSARIGRTSPSVTGGIRMSSSATASNVAAFATESDRRRAHQPSAVRSSRPRCGRRAPRSKPRDDWRTGTRPRHTAPRGHRCGPAVDRRSA